MNLLRDTPYGRIEGVDDGSGTWSWKGIPFARPPVGALRWRAPLEPEPWSGVRPARAFGPAGAQPGSVFGPGLNDTWDATVVATLNRTVGSEDCLYLNVWRPASPGTGLPVIAFLYGGSNTYGHASDPLYDGAALARAANAVVVTANYRLGLLGWLNLPQLKEDADPLGASGNFGTLDQIAFLTYINRAIASFGGDPGNVTVMGQSAGAVNLCTLLTSPRVVHASPRLIHRAILVSGEAALPGELPPGGIATLRPAEYSERQGQTLLNGLLAADGLAADDEAAQAYLSGRTAAEVAAYLRSKTPAELHLQLYTRLAPAGLMATSHHPDGAVVARSPIEAFRSGQCLDVPMLLGTTRDETRLFPSWLALSPALGGVPGLRQGDAELAGHLLTFDGDAPPALTPEDLVHPAYLPVDAPGTGYFARLDLLNRFFFIALRNATTDALAPRRTDLWHFRFDWAQEPAPWDTVYGAAHVFDLPFLFGNFDGWAYAKVMNSAANAGGRQALSSAMMGAVAAFARSGDPNHAGLGIAWPAWPRSLVFDATRTEARITVIEAP